MPPSGNWYSPHVKCNDQLMVDGWFGLVVWIPGIPWWKGLLLGGTPRIWNHRAPNHQLTTSWNEHLGKYMLFSSLVKFHQPTSHAESSDLPTRDLHGQLRCSHSTYRLICVETQWTTEKKNLKKKWPPVVWVGGKCLEEKRCSQILSFLFLTISFSILWFVVFCFTLPS